MNGGQAAGPERFILALALLVPLGFMLWLVGQVPGASLAAPTTPVHAESDAGQLIKRPLPSSANAAPPPTLAVPTATPRPTATPVPTPMPSPTRQTNRTYTVKKGDELRHIAADYGVSIWKIIQNNDIPNPDSLRVGQVLKIPDD